MATQVDDDINIEQLKLLKKAFEEADNDGSGELDIDEFCQHLGPFLGAHLTNEQVRQLFLKIDADAGGTVDWDEFTNYLFLQRAEHAGESASEAWRLFPQDFKDRNDLAVQHRGPADKVYYCEAIDKYVSCGRDGTYRLWNGADLRHFKTLSIGSSWITDCIYMPLARKLVFTTVDRAISYYEASRGAFELTGRVYASGSMGVPQSLGLVTNDAGEQLVYGDTKGSVLMLLCGTREWPARDMISTDEHQDYICIHAEHTDWVTQVTWVPEVGLVSSSVDSTIKVYDFVREKVINTCTHHIKGVHSFVWCRAYSMFASCGQERDIILWQGNTMRRVGELTGHTASVTHIALDERLNQVFTLAVDKTIKVWDLRNHKCLQTIMQDEWAKASDSHVHCLTYDQVHRRVVTAASKPYVWVHKMVTQDRAGHMDSVRSALFNSVFGVVVSVDEAGTVCTWDMATGAREGRFTKAHRESRVTAAVFDTNERRLVTVANDGSVRMWNFNNGSLLRQYLHEGDADKTELACVVYASDKQRDVDAVFSAGWGCKVYVWETGDDAGEVVSGPRMFEGHREDILCMAECAERMLLATGDYEGRINVYGLFTGDKKVSLFHRAERYETSVERLQWLLVPSDDAAQQQQQQLLLLSAGGDGLVRVWITSAGGKLLCTLPGSHGRLEMITALAVTPDSSRVLVGDSAGHMRVYDISGGVDIRSPDACRACFKQVLHWRAHESSINHISPVLEHGVMVLAGKDCNVSVWSLDGGFVGIFGEHAWTLSSPDTWQDASGSCRAPPAQGADSLFVTDDDGAAAAAAAVVRVKDESEMTEEDVDKDYSPMQKVSLLLAERRVRQSQRPANPHSMLEIRTLQDVPASALDLLQGGSRLRRVQGGRGGGGSGKSVPSNSLGTRLAKQ